MEFCDECCFFFLLHITVFSAQLLSTDNDWWTSGDFFNELNERTSFCLAYHRPSRWMNSMWLSNAERKTLHGLQIMAFFYFHVFAEFSACDPVDVPFAVWIFFFFMPNRVQPNTNKTHLYSHRVGFFQELTCSHTIIQCIKHIYIHHEGYNRRQKGRFEFRPRTNGFS